MASELASQAGFPILLLSSSKQRTAELRTGYREIEAHWRLASYRRRLMIVPRMDNLLPAHKSEVDRQTSRRNRAWNMKENLELW